MTTINTKDLLDIDQVFHHKQHRQAGLNRGEDGSFGSFGTNDYVLIVLKINSEQLQQFYGHCKYLVQIWRNKKRLFQHAHHWRIKNIHLNKTEIAYTLDVPADIIAEHRLQKDDSEARSSNADLPFDCSRNFIYVVQPFTQQFARIENPFDEEEEYFGNGSDSTVLYVSDEYLIIAQNHQLKYTKTESFFQCSSQDGICQDKSTRKTKYFKIKSLAMLGNFGSINNFAQKKKESTARHQQHVVHQQLAPLSAVMQEPTIAQRTKEMKNNRSLYSDPKSYDDLRTSEIEFETCTLGLTWKILAIEHLQIATCECSESNGLVVYAGQKGNLILQAFRLNLGQIQTQNQPGDDDLDEENKIQSKQFVELDCWKGAKTKGDEYQSLQIVQIDENQTLAILKTKDGHVDITNSNLIFKTKSYKQKMGLKASFSGEAQDQARYQEPDRFTNKEIKLRGKVNKIILGLEKLNFLCEQGDSTVAYQYSLNSQTGKVDYSSRQEFASFNLALLSEDFFRSHISLFDDLKIFSGIVALVHGQVISFYNTILKTWHHHFNKRVVARSNTWTNYFLQQLKNANHENDEEEFDFIPNPLTKSEQSVTESIPFAMSDHSYFNRKEYEIIKIEFLPQQSSNFYEILICQQGGLVRKVNIAYQNQGFDDKMAGAHITCQTFLSKCGNVNKRKDYFAVSLSSKANYSVYREVGVLEKKVFIQVIDNDTQELAIDYYASNDDNTVSKFLTLDSEQAQSIVEIPVQNSKHSHLFLYNKKSKDLSIYSVEQASLGSEMSAYTLQSLNQERLLLRIPKFDYSPMSKYYQEENFLFYTWKGNVEELNLFTGEKLKRCFGGYIMDHIGCFLPGKQFCYRQRQVKDNINYTNLNFTRQYMTKCTFNDNPDQEIDQTYFQTFLAINACPILKNESSLHNFIEYDMINNDVALFTSPTDIVVLPNLGQYEREGKGTFQFDKKFIASNVDKGYMIQETANMTGKESPLKFKTLEEQHRLLKYTCPSDFVQSFCALDASENMLQVWNMGTGKLQSEIKLVSHDFKGFKRHNVWKESTLVHRDRETALNLQVEDKLNMTYDSKSMSLNKRSTTFHKSKYIMHKKLKKELTNSMSGVPKKDEWRKIRVQESGVIVEREFYHDYKPGATLFVGSANDILLEFTEDWINIYQIRNDNSTQFLDEVKRDMMANADVPAYFSPDFKRYLTFDTSLKETYTTFKLNETHQKFDTTFKSKQFERFKVVSNVKLPEFSQVQLNSKGQPYIFFNGRDYISSLMKNNIEQTIKIENEDRIKENQDQILEQAFSSEDLFARRTLDSLNFQPHQMATLQWEKKLELKNYEIKSLSSQIKQIKYLMSLDEDLTFLNAVRFAELENLVKTRDSFSCSMASYSVNNLRFIKTYSYTTWRLIEQICNDQVDLNYVDPEKIKELLLVILPNGQTLTNLLIQSSNLGQLEKLIKYVEQQDISFELVADFHGNTPLHECVNNTYTKAAEDLLKIIGKNSLGRHVELIQDILPDLVEICPLATSDYFSHRMMPCPWSLKHTIGNLKTTDSNVDFGVYSNPLNCVDKRSLEDKLFEAQEADKGSKCQEFKRLPLQIRVFDFPRLHHFNNPIGRDLITAISEAQDMTIFDQKYVQALLEYQWPAVRSVILRDLFIPYLVFLVAFNFYAIFQFEREEQSHDMSVLVQGYFVKILLVFMSFYFLFNEWTQFKNETSPTKYLTNIWNYVDVIPILLVLTAIVLSVVAEVEGGVILQIERYLNAVASFFIWFKFLYFFRIFRSFGHLIKTIIEVLVDMKVFLVILSFSILAFSGTFFILAQNNTGDDVFVESYPEAIMRMFELTLGSFDTSQFGTTGYAVVYMMFAIGALFQIVVMLNLLIAIISDTFANVQSQAEKKMYQEFAQLICENFHLLSEDDKQAHDSQGNYLFISEIHQGV